MFTLFSDGNKIYDWLEMTNERRVHVIIDGLSQSTIWQPWFLFDPYSVMNVNLGIASNWQNIELASFEPACMPAAGRLLTDVLGK